MEGPCPGCGSPCELGFVPVDDPGFPVQAGDLVFFDGRPFAVHLVVSAAGLVLEDRLGTRRQVERADVTPGRVVGVHRADPCRSFLDLPLEDLVRSPSWSSWQARRGGDG
jgi:hypothetical protein